MAGITLIMIAAICFIRGLLRITKPSRSSMYKAWRIKFDTEPTDTYVHSIIHSGKIYIITGAVLSVCGLLLSLA